MKGLPVSQKTLVIVFVDHFPKAWKFVPLTKLLANLLLQHVVQVHSFPKDMVFMSRFWKAFWEPPSASPQDFIQTERGNHDLKCSLRCLHVTIPHLRCGIWSRWNMPITPSDTPHWACHFWSQFDYHGYRLQIIKWTKWPIVGVVWVWLSVQARR